MKYLVVVHYRTNSGCNAKTVEVAADDTESALTMAGDKVRRQRGVIRIDGSELSRETW